MNAEFDWDDLGKRFVEAGERLSGRLRQAAKTLREAHTADLTPEQSEAAAQRRYVRAIASERRAGLEFVAAEAARVRKELGLRD